MTHAAEPNHSAHITQAAWAGRLELNAKPVTGALDTSIYQGLCKERH